MNSAGKLNVSLAKKKSSLSVTSDVVQQHERVRGCQQKKEMTDVDFDTSIVLIAG